MSQPLPAPEFQKWYILVSQSSTSLYFSLTGSAHTPSYGTGFYPTREAAEQARTVSILADKNTPPYSYHVFELEVPNPAYQKTD